MKGQQTEASIVEIYPFSDTLLKIRLKPQHYIPYEAGQYLNLMPRFAKADPQLLTAPLSYSIANAPLGAHEYELHLRHYPDNQTTTKLLQEMRQYGTLTLELPYGNCTLAQLNAEKPIIFIAGGTGFAPIQAMIEELLASGDKRPFELYWSARTVSDLYLHHRVLEWADLVSQFHYYPCISSTSAQALQEHLQTRHQQDWSDWQFVMSGPFEMVYSLRDLLVQRGVARTQMFSDAFSFEEKR